MGEAQICFGIVFENGYEFPWSDDKYDNDIEKWWLSILEFKPSVEIYTKNGQFTKMPNGKNPSKQVVHKYWDERTEFLKNHPVPVDLLEYGFSDNPSYILAVPSSFLTAGPENPEEFDPSLTVKEVDVQILINFCKKYDIEYDNNPSWHLTCFE